MKRNIFFYIFCILFTIVNFLIFVQYLGHSQGYKSHEIIKQNKHKLDVLPVCAKGQISESCRQLAADEMGATVRGVKEDDPEN